MRVKVLFFGQLKDLAGTAEEQVELPAGARLADLFAHYQKRIPRWEEFRPSIAVAVNQQYADSAHGLQPEDEVAFLPPVSGGASVGKNPADRVQLVRAPIAIPQVVVGLKGPSDGAVAVFEGIVRNRSGRRQTLYLDYEAYEPMALEKMREIATDLHARFPVDAVAIIHRLGRLQIGETSVLIAVSAPHRAPAFDACRHGIERLKCSVPIWKKEYFSDGAVWVDGQNLQPEINAGPVNRLQRPTVRQS
jgi:molybdopterin synthase catalytic subunit